MKRFTTRPAWRTRVVSAAIRDRLEVLSGPLVGVAILAAVGLAASTHATTHATTHAAAGEAAASRFTPSEHRPTVDRPTVHSVAIDGTRFQPGVVTVHAGDPVVWVNKDPFPHTATSAAGGFDSGQIAAGQSWTFTPRKKGVYTYTCTLHSTMTATLRVD
jgi:plastocyanin